MQNKRRNHTAAFKAQAYVVSKNGRVYAELDQQKAIEAVVS